MYNGKVLRDRLCRVTGWSSIEEDPSPRLSCKDSSTLRTALFKNIINRGVKINFQVNVVPYEDRSFRFILDVEKYNMHPISLVEVFIDLLAFR